MQKVSLMIVPPDQPKQAPDAPANPLARRQVVHRMSRVRRGSSGRMLRLLVTRLLFPAQRVSGWKGYAAAVLGVALASGVIGVIGQFIHITNISLMYLPIILWLATAFGWAAAFLASALAFLAYDFFFIPPVHRLTVDDPSEWLSLFAFLITALVLSQLTALVQARARDAQESQQRTATLYALAQLIASTTNQQRLLDALAQRVLDVFTSAGVRACALFLPDTSKQPAMRATAGGALALDAFNLEQREQFALAGWALTHGSPVGQTLWLQVERRQQEYHLIYAPLQSRREVVGVLGLLGTPETCRLVSRLARVPESSAALLPAQTGRGPETELFEAFCDQIALALERATLQQQAIHAAALSESNRLKDVLLGSVSHELRTPLASIQAAASSMLEPEATWSPAEQQELLESITTSARRLNRLVSNLLDLSRLEAGVANPQKDWHFIGEIVATVLDQLDLAGQGQDHQLQVDIPETVPLVPMDHEQIEQVLTNLIENALKYSPAGSVIQIQARVKAAPEEGEVLEVQISDQGIGIPASELQAIFDKFYRVQQVRLPWTRSRPPTGTGLGLAICATIIQAHGGRIWAESALGKGAAFFFTLPIPAGGVPASLASLKKYEGCQPAYPSEVTSL